MDIDPPQTVASGVDPNSNIYPIAVLIEELKHDDLSLRLNAVKRLDTIAAALGPQRARDELIPFLEESIDDEDEILLALAESLGSFTDLVGGPDHAHELLGVLENLAAVEETVVRDKAVESLNQICRVLSEMQLMSHYIPLVKRLTMGDWFTSRTSATGLYSVVYERMQNNTEIADELRTMFVQLSNDDTPMVRRAAAKAFAPLVKVVGKKHLLADLIPVFNKLAEDEQDSVRLLTVEDLVAIAQTLTPAECKELLLQPLRNLASDKSWRVRYMVALKFRDIADAVGEDIIKEELVPAFVHSLKDNEGEVRSAASGQVPGFCRLIERDTILNQIMPCVKDLVTDTSQHVRAALAMEISGLAPLLGKESTIENLLPLFLQLLKDEFPDVRLNIISKIQQVNEVIGIELLSQSLLPAIMELAEDKQWRVRLAIIDYLPLLASQLGMDFFNTQLLSMCLSWLGDAVFSIREAATANLKKLTEVFGVDWAKEAIIPKVLEISTSPTNYLYRMTGINAITIMAQAVTPEVIKDQILPSVRLLVNDPIPNIRFNVAKSLETIAPLLKQSPDTSGLIESDVKPDLIKLTEDSDNDVRFFAQRALLSAQ
ncbi:hypothetical protein BZG36_01553 [Bifiguratus adelaidae]|uniref:Phosphatase PP2A regulatory subunit A/Splicing factor 3B subunit 1-like HEAT repeat domain-containing protein n=1 Tax=Bifiguratus adelaidae TaxID=1938954 RepID=A0A261Y3Z4_9FUNG|nr:hypothetical protein BZG36_01553 [Bifiguratus adelaidae]